MRDALLVSYAPETGFFMASGTKVSFPDRSPDEAARLIRQALSFLKAEHEHQGLHFRLQVPPGSQGDPTGLLIFGAVPLVALAINELIAAFAKRGCAALDWD